MGYCSPAGLAALEGAPLVNENRRRSQAAVNAPVTHGPPTEACPSPSTFDPHLTQLSRSPSPAPMAPAIITTVASKVTSQGGYSLPRMPGTRNALDFWCLRAFRFSEVFPMLKSSCLHSELSGTLG